MNDLTKIFSILKLVVFIYEKIRGCKGHKHEESQPNGTEEIEESILKDSAKNAS